MRSFTLVLQVKEVSVIRGMGTDKISIQFAGPPQYTYEGMNNQHPSFNLDVTAGYAEVWLEKMGFLPDDYQILDHSQKGGVKYE